MKSHGTIVPKTHKIVRQKAESKQSLRERLLFTYEPKSWPSVKASPFYRRYLDTHYSFESASNNNYRSQKNNNERIQTLHLIKWWSTKLKWKKKQN